MTECIRFPAYVRVTTDEEMQALARKRGAVLAWMAERQRAKDERERLKAEARNRAIRDFWRKDKPATVHHITEGRR